MGAKIFCSVGGILHASVTKFKRTFKFNWPSRRHCSFIFLTSKIEQKICWPFLGGNTRRFYEEWCGMCPKNEVRDKIYLDSNISSNKFRTHTIESLEFGKSLHHQWSCKEMINIDIKGMTVRKYIFSYVSKIS